MIREWRGLQFTTSESTGAIAEALSSSVGDSTLQEDACRSERIPEHAV